MNEKITAFAMVIQSPWLSASEPDPGLRATKPTPVRQMIAATRLISLGCCLATSHAANGVSTQYEAVRKALRPGSMVFRPSVCMIIVP